MTDYPVAPGTDAPDIAANGHRARFVTGSTMRHVVIMTLTGAVGLMAMFLVDFADLFFLALLGETQITAAVGFAGTLAFVNLSISLGLGIAAAALVSQNLGAGKPDTARHFATNALAVTVLMSLVLAGGMAFFADELLAVLGAKGEALVHGRVYLQTLTWGFPFWAAAVSFSFSLRAVGDPQRAMYITLAAAVANGVLDPIFIFGLDLGVRGAALASICANFASFALGLYGLVRVHGFLNRFSLNRFATCLRPIFFVAIPAILTQLATPFAIAYLTRATAPFGDEAVAAVTIINRLVPVAFGVIFALSGAVGPIIGQNYGAMRYDRVRKTLSDALLFSTIYTVLTCALLFALRHHIPHWFLAKSDTVPLVTFFCSWMAAGWIFAGAQFVSQASFNNLGKPHWSTAFNWGKATVGLIPLVYIGAKLYGPYGVLLGQALSSVMFGIAATATAFILVRRIAVDQT